MATDTDVAAHLDISDRTVRELRKRGVLAETARGASDLDACRVAYIRHLREQAAGRGSGEEGKLVLAEERARLAAEQANAAAMKNALARGELVPVGAITSAVVGLIEVSKARLAKVPAAVAKKDAALKDRIATAIEDALEDLSATRVDGRATAGVRLTLPITVLHDVDPDVAWDGLIIRRVHAHRVPDPALA